MQNTMSRVAGWGVDKERDQRPGVPEELDPPRPAGNPHWRVPPQQVNGKVTALASPRGITPVYGTAVPMRGVSGMIRRAAYRLPDYKTRRWLLLMLADRVDVLEHNPPSFAVVAGAAATIGLGVLVARALRR